MSDPTDANVPPKTGTVSRQVWVLGKVGSIGDLTITEETLSPPNEGEVQIAVKSIGLNFADVYACKGLYAAAPKENFTPGFEISGVITEVNYGPEEKKDEDAFKAGDRVLALLRFGGYATHHNVGSRYVKKIPDDWSFQQAAAFPVQALTAYYALVALGNVEKDHVVLIHSAAGGVGQYALKICDKIGAKTIGTVGISGKSKEEFLVEKLGLSKEQIIVRADSGKEFEKQLVACLSSMEEDGVDLVCDSLLGDYFFPVHKKVRPMGRHIIIGSGSLTTQGDSPAYMKLGYRYLMRPKLDLLPLIGSNRSVMGFNLVYLFSKLDKLEQYYTGLLDMNLEPAHVGEEFDFKDAQDALRKFQTGETMGKVVLNVGD